MLTNQDNRKKRDLTGVRTPEDVMRRLADNVKITSDEVKGLTIEVSGKVGNDEVISKINQSPEAVTIQANKIKLEGYTTINNGFSVDLLGNMTCNGAAIKNAVFDAINDTDDPSIILKNANNNTNYLKTTINPSQIHLTDTLYTPGEIHLEPAIYLDSSTYGNTYLGASGCYSPSFTQTSQAEKKKNFEKLDSGLDILKDVDIYKYNLKSENDTDKKHIGFVIGEDYKYRQELTDIDNKGVDLYSFISVCCKAIQELQNEVEELKKKVKK